MRPPKNSTMRYREEKKNSQPTKDWEVLQQI